MRYLVAPLLLLFGCAERNEVIAVVEGGGGSGGGGPVLVATASQALVCGEGAALAVASVNADAHGDVIVAGGCLSVYGGAGDGNLAAGESAAATFGDAMAVGDVNGDGTIDALGFDGQTTVLLGDGMGGFQPTSDVPAAGPGALGDVALGAELDLVLRSGTELAEWTGDGSGAFIGPHPFAIAHPIEAHALGHFGGDPHADVVVASGGVAVVLSQGDGSFHAPQFALHVDAPEAVRELLVIDLDGDGCDDAVAFDGPQGGLLRTLLGSCDGTLAQRAAVPLARAAHAAAGDIDGDGRVDVVAALAAPDGGIAVLHGLGDGNLEAPIIIPFAGDPRAVATDDMNEDGRVDVVVLTRSDVHVLLNESPTH